jgi:hypothetical protein
MISVFVYRPLPNGNGIDVLAEVEVRRGKLQVVGGRRGDLVDDSRSVYSPRTRRQVSVDDDAEEWLRSFAESFRTAQVIATIVRDTSHPELEAPRQFVDELRGAAHAHA